MTVAGLLAIAAATLAVGLTLEVGRQLALAKGLPALLD
jgi:hypothetical protein